MDSGGSDTSNEDRIDDQEMLSEDGFETDCDPDADFEMQEDEMVDGAAEFIKGNFEMTDDTAEDTAVDDPYLSFATQLLPNCDEDDVVFDVATALESLDLNENKEDDDLSFSMTSDKYNPLLLTSTKEPSLAQLKTCNTAYKELCNAISTQSSSETSHCIYLILKPLKKNITFCDLIQQVLYAGSGVYTRPFDHFIMAHHYEKVFNLVSELGIRDEKHDAIVDIWKSGKSPLLIRYKTNKPALSLCLEYGLIEAFGLSNLVGNKMGGVATHIPVGFPEQKVIEASCAVLFSIYYELTQKSGKVLQNQSIVLSENFDFESIVMNDLLKYYQFPFYGTGFWTKSLIENAEKSETLKNCLGKMYSTLIVSQIKFQSKATSEDRRQYYRETAHRRFQNTYALIYNQKPKFYEEMSQEEKSTVRNKINELADLHVQKLKVDNPAYLERKKEARRLVRRKYRKTPKGRQAEDRSRKKYRSTPLGIATTQRAYTKYNKSEKRKKADDKYKKSEKRKKTAGKYDKSDKGILNKAKHAGHFKKDVIVKKASGSCKCKECSKKISKNENQVCFWGRNFHVKCLIVHYSFKFNTKEFNDWIGTDLLKNAEKKLIEEILVVYTP